MRTIIEADHSEHLPEFELAYNTRRRKGNLYGLTWGMVNWTGRMLNIPAGKSKNGKALHIPLKHTAMAGLKTVYQRGEKSVRIFRSRRRTRV